MARNLWIGTPGRLREIRQAAKSWDRTAELNVSEFKALEGRITTFAPARTTRRMKLAFDWLEPADAQHLVQLARRIGTGRGPLAVLDPASVNLLDPYQAAGQSQAPGGGDHWFTMNGAITLAPSAEGNTVADCQDVAAAVGWIHGTWAGWPVAPGMKVSWLLPAGWDPAVATAQLDWKDASGGYLSTSQAVGTQVTGTAPAGAAFATPVGKPGATGQFGLAGACFTIGETPVANALGDGCPAMSVTAYGDVPATRLPYRNVSIDLVEVRRAAL
ncbi:hypothetical protein [Streptomyces sp. NBC_01304]|uniref:hypothetical protein n=1 Tax=Streptomyces sp. NBC_01304 TaxID=2903818 RepID=UPI002E13F357|nr:hypothetical protein OG430_23925 [Streptomyces sp. NBC_01304]